MTKSSEEAKVLIKQIKEAKESTKGILKDKKILIVFGVVFNLKKEIYISGNHLYFADIIRASGNQNAFDENTSKQPTLSYEGIVKLNPDIIYILAHRVKDADKKALIAPWLSMPTNAAKHHTIYITTEKYAGMPSQRVVKYMADFREVLKDAKGRFTSVSDPK